jgi:hypothetical protein
VPGAGSGFQFGECRVIGSKRSSGGIELEDQHFIQTKVGNQCEAIVG